MLAMYVYSQTENTINARASYIGEGFANFTRGLQKGETYLGKIHFGIEYKPKFFNNGEFSAHIENTHGGNPSRDYIGDLQVASNIDNGDYTYLSELWYKHSFNNLFVKFGIIDLNSDYLNSNCGGVFLNSSFGIQPSASLNMPVPIFPMNALGVNLQYSFFDKLILRTGIWDGNPGDLNRNPYNVQWKLSKSEGILSATEFEYKYKNGLGNLKFGMLYHSANFKTLSDTSCYIKGNFQFHFIFEQVIVYDKINNKPKIDVFANIGYLPNNEINVIPLSFSGGVYYSNVFLNKIDDKIGFAFSYAKISDVLLRKYMEYKTKETLFELTYTIEINNNISIQPDLQYIFNSGVNNNVSDAFVGFLRVIINT